MFRTHTSRDSILRGLMNSWYFLGFSLRIHSTSWRFCELQLGPPTGFLLHLVLVLDF